MIISRRHSFLFVKTRKSAGSSIEIALSRLCGPGDIVTRLSDEEEEARQQEGGYGPAGHEKPLYRYRPRELYKWLRHRRIATWFSNHAGLSTARELVDDTTWKRLVRITSERNPWDKAVSRYYWQKRRWEQKPRRSPFPPFEDYLEYLEHNKPHWLSCWGIYTLDGAVGVDKFVFYEDLAGGLAWLGDRLGLESPIELPRYRAKARGGGGRDYREEYSSRSSEIVRRVCCREIEYFGYAFEAPGRVPALAQAQYGSG